MPKLALTLKRVVRQRLCLLLGWSLFMANTSLKAEVFSKVEKFNCGRLGIVIVSSSPKALLRAGHLVYKASISIPSRKLNQVGVLHSSMGGNDRSFTTKATDNFRSVDDTTSSNPVMISILGRGYFYGKQRQQITVTTLNEAYSCIPC